MLVTALALVGCRSPTEITVALTTDIPCSEFKGDDLYAGSSTTLAGNPITTQQGCPQGGSAGAKVTSLGTIVLAPTTDDTATVNVTVVAATSGTNAAACAANLKDLGPDCIVARRTLAYVPHTPLTLEIEITKACKGVKCDPGTTCQNGACVKTECAGSSGSGMGSGSNPLGHGAELQTTCEMDAGIVVPPEDAGSGDEGAEGGMPVYNSLTDLSNWRTVDLYGSWGFAGALSGGTFDGQYVYFAPATGSVFVRYDTLGPFGDGASWDFSAPSSLFAGDFAGAAFDGTAVYYVPSLNAGGQMARYVISKPFEIPGAWTSIYVGGSFVGGAYRSPFLYLSPADGFVARVDLSKATVADGGFLSAFDALNNMDGVSFFGAVADDDDHIFFVPGVQADGGASPYLLRYRAKQPFLAPASWATLKTSLVAHSAAYRGGAFDGTYVYLAPATTSGIVRCDTTRRLAPSSCDLFDPVTHGIKAPGQYFGSAFDGRWVYFIPAGVTTGSGSVQGSTILTRYDTTREFRLASSWETLDLATLPSGTATIGQDTARFAGAVFDGEFLYLIPNRGVAARFDARTPKAAKGTFTPSFY